MPRLTWLRALARSVLFKRRTPAKARAQRTGKEYHPWPLESQLVSTLLAAKHGCPIADSSWTRMLRTDTDTSPLSRNAEPQRSMRFGIAKHGWPIADSSWTRMLRTDTDTSPLSRYAEPQRSMRVGLPNPHAPRVNAGHQRWCPGFSRQAWLADRRFVLDTDSTDRHGYIAFEPLCGAPAEHAGRNRRIPMPRA